MVESDKVEVGMIRYKSQVVQDGSHQQQFRAKVAESS